MRRTPRLLVIALGYATLLTGCSRSNNAELAQARAEAEAATAEAAAAKARLAKLQGAPAVAQTPTNVFTEELVYVQSKDGIAGGGAIFAPPKDSAKPIAVIWIHGWGVNFYEPTYVKIGRALADPSCVGLRSRRGPDTWMQRTLSSVQGSGGERKLQPLRNGQDARTN